MEEGRVVGRRRVPVHGATLLSGFFLVALLVVTAALAFTLTPGQVHTPSPSIELTYSDAVNITGGTLYDRSGAIIRQYGANNFTDTSGNGTTFTVALGLLSQDQYRLEVNKQERTPPYRQLADDVVWFSYVAATSGLQLNLNGTHVLAATLPAQSPTGIAVPETRFATSKPYAITVTSKRPAWDCRYSSTLVSDPNYMARFTTTGAPNAGVTTHTIDGQHAASIEPLLVWCNSSAGPTLSTFAVGYEDAPPVLQANFSPDLIVDPSRMRTNLSITTSNHQKVYCEVSDGTDTHSSVERLGQSDAGAYSWNPWISVLFASQPASRVVKRFNLTCWNRAGLNATLPLTITIDLNQSPSLDQLAPARYATAAPLLSLRAVKAGLPVTSARCTFGNGNLNLSGDLDSSDGIIYTKALPALSDGAYSQAVMCTIANGERVDGSIDFVLDSTPPPARTLQVPPVLCGAEPLTATVNLSKYTVEDPNFKGYAYNITYSKGNVVLESGFRPGPEMAADLEAEENETYKWHVWPVDLAGNRGTELAGLTKMIAPGSVLCDHEPPVGIATVKQTPAGALVSITCDDGDGSGCTDNYRYDKLAPNATPAQCAYASTEPYGRNLTFYENGTLCYLVADKNENNDTGFQTITVKAGLPNASSHCANGVHDPLETGVDCGGQCPAACDAGSNCILDADCQSGFCNDTQECEVTSCTDGVQNGRETGLDCGGPSCPTCTENSTCTGNADCDDGLYCDDGTCTPQPTPSDCDTNSDCSSGEECLDGVCLAQSGCTADSDCAADQTCESGSCVTTTAARQSSLLSIILIILGLLLMGGSGYWLFTLHQQRQEAVAVAARKPLAQPQAQQRLSPAQRLALAKQRQAQLQMMKERARARVAAKEAKRQELLEKFGGGEKQSEASGSETSSEGATGGGQSDEFIDVRDIGKKEKTHTAAAKTSDTVTKKDAFSELDDVVGGQKGTTKEDVFGELDEVIGEKKDVGEGRTSAKKSDGGGKGA